MFSLIKENFIENLSYETIIGLGDHSTSATLGRWQSLKFEKKITPVGELNYWKGDYSKLGKTLKDTNWTQILEKKDANDQSNCLKSILLDAGREFSVESKTQIYSWVPQRMNDSYNDVQDKKNRGKAWARYKECQPTINYKEYKWMQNEINTMVWIDQNSHRKNKK